MNYSQLIRLTSILLALSCFIQSLEYLSLKYIFNSRGIFRSQQLNVEVSFFKVFLQKLTFTDFFYYILFWRLISSLLLMFSTSPFVIFSLLLTQLLLAFRFKGTFNGGSDYMTLLTIAALFSASLSPNNKLFFIPFMYLAVQVILSYFLAGVAKLRDKEWRDGPAICNIINGPNFAPPDIFKFLVKNKIVAFFICWMIIGFELLLPLIVFFPGKIFLVLMGLFFFHLINFFIFGLNRFVFAWVATYPALIYFIFNLKI